MVSADVFERERSRFSLQRDWGETARITASSGPYLFANNPAWLKCEPGLRWVTPDSRQISPVRILPACETKSRASLHVCFLLAWRQLPWQPYHANTCNQSDNFAWSLAHEQITNHKLFFFLYALTMAARGLIHWSCMMAIWRASACVCVCVSCERACVGVCTRGNVGRYAHHEVAPHASQQHLLPSLCASPVGFELMPSRAD